MGPQGNIKTLLPKWCTEAEIIEEHNLFISDLMYEEAAPTVEPYKKCHQAFLEISQAYPSIGFKLYALAWQF